MASESDGPDRFNRNPSCRRHHEGVRTDINDRCCCCDPCAYVRKSEATSQPEHRHCCRCIPRWIMLKFVGGSGACCRNIAVIMHAKVKEIGAIDVIQYTGNLGGHGISVYLSSHSIDEYGGLYDAGYQECRWTIHIPSLNADHEITIDHQVVTCLGVPEVVIENVTLFGNCVGTVTIVNYATVKVPFQHVDPPAILSPTVPFPGGYGPCDTA